MKKFAIGADIGGSHISCAAIDLEKEIIVKGSSSSVEVDNRASSDEIIKKWCLALNTSIASIGKNQLAGIGFAMPGPFDYENGIAKFTPEVAKFENLYGVNVARNMGKILGLPGADEIRFMNDATAFAVGESWMGRAKGFERSVSVTLGTGFGSAFIDHGIPVVGRENVPKSGYVYNIPYRNSIADDYFSTRWFIKSYWDKTGITEGGVKEIAGKAIPGNAAHQMFVEFGLNLGEFLGPLLHEFGAEVLVIGGNIAGAFPLFGPHFMQSLDNQDIHIPVNCSELKESAALIGSARLFDDYFWTNVKPLLSEL